LIATADITRQLATFDETQPDDAAVEQSTSSISRCDLDGMQSGEVEK
jgi:hypothetical protein